MSKKQTLVPLGLCLALALIVWAIAAPAGFGKELAPENEYDPHFDVAPPFGAIDVGDIQAVSAHWNTTGVYTSTTLSWALTGNAGTVPGVNFLGTTDNVPLELRANGIGIGTSTPMSALQIVGNYVQIPAGSGAPLAEDCDEQAEAGRVIGRTDGYPIEPSVYVCRGLDGWTGIGAPPPQLDALQERLGALEAQNADLQARLAALEKALASK